MVVWLCEGLRHGLAITCGAAQSCRRRRPAALGSSRAFSSCLGPQLLRFLGLALGHGLWSWRLHRTLNRGALTPPARPTPETLPRTSSSPSVPSTGRGAARVPRQILTDGVLYSSRVTDLSQLATDDDAAAAEAEAQGGVPGYCGDRALRAYAGGQYCQKFDR